MAAFFWIGLGANTNWSTVNNWSATSGGVTNAATPSVTSDVTFDGVGVSGNTASVVSGTQSVLSLTFTSGYTQSVTLNGALTIAGNFTDNTAHSWAGASSMTISAASTITSGGKTFPNAVFFSGSNTKTLSGDWTIAGTLTISTATTTINKTASETLSVAGFTVSNTVAGTINLTITGGIWSGTSTNTITGTITLTGTLTVSGTVFINGCTLVNSSATVTTTSSTLRLAGSTTINTNGINWNNILISTTGTYTINSLFSATGTLTINDSIVPTFAGTSGFSVATLTCIHTSAATITLVNTVTYTITTAFNCFLSRNAAIVLFTSDHASNKAILTLNNGATCNVLASFTRIDASNGRPILSFNGTITTCTNVFSYTDVAVPPSILVRKFGRRKEIYDRAKTVLYQIP